MNNPINSYIRSVQGLPLTPGERAFLRVVKSLLISAMSAMLTTLATTLTLDNGAFNLNHSLIACLAVGLTVVGHGIQKYLSASAEPMQQEAGALIGNATDQGVAALESLDKGVDPTMQVTGLVAAVSAQQQGPTTAPTGVMPAAPTQ